MSLRKASVLLIVAGLAVGLIGPGISATFTDAVSAEQHINVGTFGCNISHATNGAVISADHKSVAYNAPDIMSSAPGSAPFTFTVSSTGSIPVVLQVTQTTPAAPFTSILGSPVADVVLNQGGTHDYAAGLQWPELTNTTLGMAVSISYSVSCGESGAATTSGDWMQFRFGPTHTGYNPNETTISASNVAGLGVAWTATTGSEIDSSPAVANGVVYIGSYDGKLYAFAVGCASGGGTCTPLWTATTGAGIGSSPAVADGVVYVGSLDRKLYAYAVGCATGGGSCSPLWTATTGGAIGNSTPAVADGVIYVGSQDGKLYAYAVGCATGGGSCSPLWTATTGGWINNAPAVANGVVYVGSGDHKLYAYAVGCATGGGSCSPLWTATAGDEMASSPAVANGVVYVGSLDHKLYAYAVGCASGGATCTPLWTATTGDMVVSSPAVANGVVYVGSHDGKLYAYSL